MFGRIRDWLFSGRRTAAGAGIPVAPQPQAPAATFIPPRAAATQTAPTPTAAFLPIAPDDLVAQASEIRRNATWMWFGRRDLIPPASDPRTKLIDRGMLSQGLLTADQLAEMHAVGDEYMRFADRQRHLVAQANATAEQAIESAAAAKAAEKAKRKAEAAIRKERRASEVAARKVKDVVFVGRGVSGRLGERHSNSALLEKNELPVLHEPAELAAALGLSVSKLRWLCFHAEVASRIHYTQFKVPKRSGGERTLSAPHKTLAEAQRWILTDILSKVSVHPSAHGFASGRSIVTNAAPHAGRSVVVNVDLSDFFPSIGFRRVRQAFHSLGYSPAVATLLALLCTECPRREVVYSGRRYFVAMGQRGLPQGACTSPAPSNMISRRLDLRLSSLAGKAGWTYTRYADDLSFSADGEAATQVGRLLAHVRHIVVDCGFRLNPSKTRVLRRNERQTVTGLVVNERPAAPRVLVRRLRAILHRAASQGLETQNREGRPDYRAWLEGSISFVAMTRPEAAGKLRAALAAVRD